MEKKLIDSAEYDKGQFKYLLGHEYKECKSISEKLGYIEMKEEILRS